MQHKKLLSLLAAAVTGISAAAIPTILQMSPCLTAFAEADEDLGAYHQGKYSDNYGGWFYYDYYDHSDGVTIYQVACGSIKPPGVDVVIPDMIADRPVTKIDARAFNNTKYHSIVLPDTVKEIGARAFEACTIEKITMPSSLKKIGDYAFSRSWIHNITIPAGVSVIGEATFMGCDQLKSISMEGVTLIKAGAFLNCNQLKEIVIREDCRAEGLSAPFPECKEITTINGHTILNHKKDENGVSYPVLDQYAFNLVNKLFAQCNGIKFIDDYCEELCEYVVATETDPWMCDALKARQLHDWLIDHCEFDYSYRGTANDLRHYIYSSFFLSFAMSTESDRLDDKMAKTVCSGYSKAYTMLLHAAGIESAVIGDSTKEGHAWNVVKINNNGVDQYYQIDTLWDDQKGSGYDYFMKSEAEMTAIHEGWLFREMDSHEGEHSWLDDYTGDYAYLKAQCNCSYQDENHDGILDNDFDLDGIDYSHDLADDTNALQGYLQFAYGFNSTPEQINDRLPEVLAELHALKKGYWDYVNNVAPVSASVPNGGTAEFKVTLFGEKLYYQWFLYVEKYNRWDFIENANGISPTLYWNANEYTNGNQFVCRIMNQDGYCLYSVPVTLTVT